MTAIGWPLPCRLRARAARWTLARGVGRRAGVADAAEAAAARCGGPAGSQISLIVHASPGRAARALRCGRAGPYGKPLLVVSGASGSFLGGSRARPCAPPGARTAGARRQGQRAVRLATAALAEDAADQRRHGDHVGGLPRLERLAEQRVLGRLQLGGSSAGRGDVGVDPGDVGVEVGDHLLAGGAVELRAGRSAFEVGLGVGRERHCAGVRSALAPPANEASWARPVWRSTSIRKRRSCGAGVAGAEHRVGARVAVDVRDAEALSRTIVTPPRFDRRFDFAGRDPEGGVLEVVGDLVVRQRRAA